MFPSKRNTIRHFYRIEHMEQSDASLLLFAQNLVTKQNVVVKLLRMYKDVRYSLGTPAERLECQLEALRRNRKFTSGVYIGLAEICELDIFQGNMGISKIIRQPTLKKLDSDCEFGLLMHPLPSDRRLDSLLKEEDDVSLRYYLQILIKRLVHMHAKLPAPLVPADGIQWGSVEQLRRKLVDNFTLLEQALASNPGLQNDLYASLKETLAQIWTLKSYQRHFGQRVFEQRIKSCHGDLKSPNIWIAPHDYQHDKQSWRCVRILDAIDFNPQFYNIDTLSDIAMLVVDIQARTKTPLLADLMLEDYLKYTRQQDEVSRSVLAYYCVEKAIVGAAVSVVDDHLPDLGLAFWKVAHLRMEDLKRRMGMMG